MNDIDLKQACIDASQAAIALFDVLDDKGIEGSLDDTNSIFKLKALVDNTELIRTYYTRRALQRMKALGIDPQEVLASMRRQSGGR